MYPDDFTYNIGSQMGRIQIRPFNLKRGNQIYHSPETPQPSCKYIEISQDEDSIWIQSKDFAGFVAFLQSKLAEGL